MDWKCSQKIRPPLLLNVPTLPHCKNDDVHYSHIHRYMRPAAVSLQRWQTGLSGITPDSPAELLQCQLLQTMCCAVFPWKIDGRLSVLYWLIWVADNITAECAFRHVNVNVYSKADWIIVVFCGHFHLSELLVQGYYTLYTSALVVHLM